MYENHPLERWRTQHHREIIVVLIKAMISTSSFVRWPVSTSPSRTSRIRAHRFGRGKIGGKAAGMYLAYKISAVRPSARADIDRYLTIPSRSIWRRMCSTTLLVERVVPLHEPEVQAT